MLRARIKSEEGGFTLIELTVAMVVMLTGLFGLVAGFDTSGKLSLISERHASMAHLAEREIERLEGVAYANLALASAPTNSTDSTNPDYYVTNGSPPTLQWNRTSTSSEPVVVDGTNGQVQAVQSWSEGSISGNIYDFVTWSTDSNCAPGCGASQNYKRITVAVTVTSGLQPWPAWSSSIVADPAAEPQQGISNGSANNPVLAPTTQCQNPSGSGLVPCISGIQTGTPNTWYLHDCATTASSCAAPSANHATNPTVGAVNTSSCSTTSFSGPPSGCPVPDVMDTNPPPASTAPPPVYNYSTDQGTGGPGGALLSPTCSVTTNGCGTDSTADCSNNSWSNSLLNTQNHMWVSSPLTATTTLTGDGALSMFSQVAQANALVSFCIALYDIPPSNGVPASLLDILIPGSQPVLLGGAAYVPPTNSSTGGNWPTTPTQTSFTFRFLPSSTTVQVAAGHRLGIRIYAKANLNLGINLLYDNPSYPASVQLNSQ